MECVMSKIIMDGRLMVFSDGRVYRIRPNGEVTEMPVSSQGTISLWEKGATHNMYVRRLVAEAFLPNPNNYKIVRVLDGDVMNNHVNNLMWINGRQRALEAHEKKRLVGLSHYQKMKIDRDMRSLDLLRLTRNEFSIVKYRSQYMTYEEIGKVLGCSVANVCSTLTHIRKHKKRADI